VDLHLPKIEKQHETTIDFDPLYESYCILNSAGEFQHGLPLKHKKKTCHPPPRGAFIPCLKKNTFGG
jgi:hypothetical protein